MNDEVLNMTVKECYDLMNADYTGVMDRLLTEKRVGKFLCMFPSDPSFTELCQALDKQDIATAFRAAHSLKGTSANLGLTELCNAASVVTEELRSGALSDAFPEELALCKTAYESVCSVIAVYQASLS